MLITTDQADEMIRLLRELVELSRARRKPKRRLAVERNRARVIAQGTCPPAMIEAVRRKMTRALKVG
jgi:hypothetical protein